MRKDILSMIEKNLSRSYFKEVRLEPFFEACFQLKEPQKLMAEPKFQEFVYFDLKYICQIL